MAGALVAWPEFATSLNGFLAKIPQIPGIEGFSVIIYAIGIGVLIGFIVEKS